MPNFLGMDTDKVLELAQLLASQSGDIGSAVAKVSSALVSTNWHGPEFDRIEREWRGHRKALAQVAEFLSDAAQVATNVANQQRAASAG
jgi:uncharacterized protein YukE